MGYVYLTTECFCCRRPFNCHPNKVPSIRYAGERRAVCRACVIRVNPLREKNGLSPIVLQPGAYEPADENEIDWNDHD